MEADASPTHSFSEVKWNQPEAPVFIHISMTTACPPLDILSEIAMDATLISDLEGKVLWRGPHRTATS